MANVLVPFLMSMFLGRTIDLRSYDIGRDMYDSEQYFEVPLNLVNTTYTVFQGNELPYNFMSLPVDIALRIKSGILTASSGNTGLNGLLGDATWKQRSVTVAVATGVQTVKRTLKNDAKPIKNWVSRISKSQTHYTKSLIYGGWSFILYTFKCDIPRDVEIVRQILTKTLGVYGLVNKDTLKIWKSAIDAVRRNHEVRGKVSIHVHTYSSFLFNQDVSSPNRLLKAINEIPKLVGSKGRPVYMELMPLHSLDKSYPAVFENHTLDKELEKIDAMYDDVHNTKNSINHWVEESEANFSDEDEAKISDLAEHLSACLKVFHKVASEASVYKNMDQNLLKSAVDLYNSKLTNYSHSYDRLFKRIKEETGRQIPTVLVPFLMSMSLGRTIDLRSYDIGGDMYDYERYFEVPLNRVNTTYTVFQGNELPYNFMSLPVDIALRIKSGILTTSSGHTGLNGLLGDATWKQRSVTVAVATGVQTVKRTLNNDSKPIKNWASRIPESQTHYTKSLIYGGWSFILYSFKCDLPGDVEIVRHILTKTLGVYGLLNEETLTKWEKAIHAIRDNHEVRGKVRIHVHTYSSFLFNYDVSSPKRLLKAINEIPKLVGPKGRPVYMELVSLHSLNKTYTAVFENHTLDKELEKIDAMYDDVHNTKNSINQWVEESETNFSDEDERKISDLAEHLSACLKVFHKVACEASVYKNMDQNLLKTAVDLYNSKLTKYAYTYDRLFRRIKEETAADCQSTFHHKIRGLLQVQDSERIVVGKVKGGLEECKEACLATPLCRSIGYIDEMMPLQKIKHRSRHVYKLVHKKKICYVYLRSSSSADIAPSIGSTSANVYDRVCN